MMPMCFLQKRRTGGSHSSATAASTDAASQRLICATIASMTCLRVAQTVALKSTSPADKKNTFCTKNTFCALAILHTSYKL